MNLMASDCLDQMVAYYELRSKDKHNDKIDSMIDGMMSLKSIMRKNDSIIVKRHTMARNLIDIPRYIGNHSCFYPIDIKSLSSHTISVLLYNENKYGRKMPISERVSLDIKILIVEAHERYLYNTEKTTISDYTFYSNHSLNIKKLPQNKRYYQLNARGMTHPIIFEPWV